MSHPAVEFLQVSKRFRLGENHGSLRDLLVAGARRILGGARRDEEGTFLAVDSVDFRVGSGEAVGIIGPNGAGKSTVLKLLSRILRPDSGAVRVHGRLAGLIEVGAGFHGDLTGRENIFLNGAILGMSRREIRRKFDDIVAFAGLESFLDMPVKRYSSGMYARLGFSVASHVDADVLLVDEVLSVGDAVFRLRCLDRMRRLVRGGTTLVFVTHDLEQMQSICTRTIVLSSGRVAYEGPPGDAVGHYLSAVSRTHCDRTTDLATSGHQVGSAEVFSVRFCDLSGNHLSWIAPRSSVVMDVQLRLSRFIANCILEVNLRSPSGHAVLSLNSGRDGVRFCCDTGVQHLRLRINDLPLSGGQYFWNVRAWDADTGACELDTPFRYPMVINENGRASGMISVEREWLLNGDETAGETGLRRALPAQIAVAPTQSDDAACEPCSAEA